MGREEVGWGVKQTKKRCDARRRPTEQVKSEKGSRGTSRSHSNTSSTTYVNRAQRVFPLSAHLLGPGVDWQRWHSTSLRPDSLVAKNVLWGALLVHPSRPRNPAPRRVPENSPATASNSCLPLGESGLADYDSVSWSLLPPLSDVLPVVHLRHHRL